MEMILRIVSVGPGRPGWLTVEAVERIRASDVVAVPAPRGEEATGPGGSLALKAASSYVPAGAEVLRLDLPMTYDVTVLEEGWKAAAEKVLERLRAGRRVSMLVLGDASLYGTGAYVAREVVALDPSVRIEVTPGVSSPSACASLLGEPLAMGNDNVTIVPDSEIDDSLVRALSMGGTVILMKLSRSIRNVLAHLDRRGLLDHARCVIRAGQEGEEVVRDVRTLRGRDVPYMSTMVVKIPAPVEESGPVSSVALSFSSRMGGGGKIFLVGIGPG
ncbi:MAG: precorrin-2 C(20)-methyltransferase, partial [Planctomycetes bacterium]|nr:precorrin-2 C(20)-methyltransferase [Planctomycetota bacterium]